MRTSSLATLAFWAMAGLVAADPAPAPPPKPYNPDWERLPSGEDWDDLYPSAAEETKAQGHTRMQCRVMASGRLDACEIIEETPAGMGFGEAMLKTARLFKMRPRTVDGQPVAGGTVVVPHSWKPVDWDALPLAPSVSPRDELWEKRPTDADLAGLYPPAAGAAKIGGLTSMNCRVKGDSSLAHCQLVWEKPQGAGFGDAALKASRLFMLKPGVATEYYQPVSVTIRWSPK